MVTEVCVSVGKSVREDGVDFFGLYAVLSYGSRPGSNSPWDCEAFMNHGS